MPDFYVQFRGDMWDGHDLHKEEITNCIISSTNETMARQWAQSVIPCIVAIYPFPFVSEADGGSPIEKDDVSFSVLPLDVFLNGMRERAEQITNRLSKVKTTKKRRKTSG